MKALVAILIWLTSISSLAEPSPPTAPPTSASQEFNKSVAIVGGIAAVSAPGLVYLVSQQESGHNIFAYGYFLAGLNFLTDIPRDPVVYSFYAATFGGLGYANQSLWGREHISANQLFVNNMLSLGILFFTQPLVYKNLTVVPYASTEQVGFTASLRF